MPYRPVRAALVAALVAAPTFTRAQAAPDALPYLPAEQLRAEARAISDGLDAYVRGWLDGDNPPEIPDGLLPSGAASTNGGAFRDWRLVRYEDIVAEDQWVVREARPVNPDSIYTLFPDPHATYIISWATLVPFGYKVVVEGRVPVGALFSTSRRSRPYWPGEYAKGYIGAGELPWVDVDIDPVPGSVNPFRPGTDRNAPNRPLPGRVRCRPRRALGTQRRRVPPAVPVRRAGPLHDRDHEHRAVGRPPAGSPRSAGSRRWGSALPSGPCSRGSPRGPARGRRVRCGSGTTRPIPARGRWAASRSPRCTTRRPRASATSLPTTTPRSRPRPTRPGRSRSTPVRSR